MDTNHIHEDVPGGVPLKRWTRGVPVEDEARRPLTYAARLPIVFEQSHLEAVNCHHNHVSSTGASDGSPAPLFRFSEHPPGRLGKPRVSGRRRLD